MISLSKGNSSTLMFAPLEECTVRVQGAPIESICAVDGEGRSYYECPVQPGGEVTFRVRGTAGCQRVLGMDQDGSPVAYVDFVLQPETGLECGDAPWGWLVRFLMGHIEHKSNRRPHVIAGRFYNFFNSWLRDHTHTMKAHKYRARELKSGVEFFLERQQPNGMIWDDVHQVHGNAGAIAHMLGEPWFEYEPDRNFVCRRIPCEADVEFLLAECVHHVWKATGDDFWMAAQLPKVEKAIEYITSDDKRWNAEAGLVKRPWTMDSWDFVHPATLGGIRDARQIPDGPLFYFYGDNAGVYAACKSLAEMWAAVGGDERAEAWNARAEALRERANDRLWMGEHYAHMVPEDPDRDWKQMLGFDDTVALSFSHGYALNRGLTTHEMAVRVLKEYQRRREHHKDTDTAEWYSIDPMVPIEVWPKHPPGRYMNGAVSPVVAGELARAAFEHGMEDYAVDMLRRLWDIFQRDEVGELAAFYHRWPEDPYYTEPNCTPLDLSAAATVGLENGAHEGVPGWSGESDNDMRNLPVGECKYNGVAFNVVDPADNGGRAVVCIGHADADHVRESAVVPAGGRKARAVWFLHAQNTGTRGLQAVYTVVYEDGTEEPILVHGGEQVGSFWQPDQPAYMSRGTKGNAQSKAVPGVKVAWRGENPTYPDVGIYQFGWNNPHPEQAIRSIRLEAAPHSARTLVAAISLADTPVGFPIPFHQGGLPDTWSNAAVVYAILEGLCGIEDADRAFRKARVSPRWAATDQDRAKAVVHYPASNGYCAYELVHEPEEARFTLDITGNAETFDVHLLMPAGMAAASVRMRNFEFSFDNTRIEGSCYADFTLNGCPDAHIEVRYTKAD